jgi:hypothetical protein
MRLVKQNEKGMALLFAIIISLFVTVLGLGLTMFSLTEFSSGREYESHLRAFAIADGGYNITKGSLRGQDLTTILTAYTNVPEYVDSEAVSGSTPPYRNPIYPIDARNVDYRNPPQPVGTIRVPGLLTPASGTALGTGYFFARVSDNADGDGDLNFDSDYSVFLRVIGVNPAPLAEITSHGGFVKNAVTVIETMVKRDTSFDLGAPLSIVGPDVNIRIQGTAFSIIGDDEHPGVSVLYDNPDSNAADAAQSVYDSLNKNAMDNITGVEGDFGPNPAPSIRDDTETVLNNPDPNAQNVMDPNFLANFIESLEGIADESYDGDTHFAGGTEFGTEDNPAITYIDGDVHLSGNGSGFGILVITGALRYTGAFDYNGLVMVIGEGDADLRGANKDITGGMIVANLEDDGSGGYQFGTPTIGLYGNSHFLFDSTSISLAMSMLPMHTTMWREITPDIEPIVASN